MTFARTQTHHTLLALGTRVWFQKLVCALCPTFEKLFWDLKVWRKVLMIGIGRKSVNEISPSLTIFFKWKEMAIFFSPELRNIFFCFRTRFQTKISTLKSWIFTASQNVREHHIAPPKPIPDGSSKNENWSSSKEIQRVRTAIRSSSHCSPSKARLKVKMFPPRLACLICLLCKPLKTFWTRTNDSAILKRNMVPFSWRKSKF